MDKTKIDWCDSTWNPITGCWHGCEYCYARKIANRFKGHADLDYFLKLEEHPEIADEKVHVLDTPLARYNLEGSAAPYPFGFDPTFHRYRLNDYINKKGRNIFVCSMSDLFGKWVPPEWRKEVFGVCERASQHNYLFLTKNPYEIPQSSYIYNGIFGRHSNNYWFGTTITCQKDLEDRLWPLLQVQGHTFLSIEPILDKMNLDCIWVSEKNKEIMLSLPKKTAYYFGGGQSYHMPEWVIIGAETGRRKDKVVPKREWIEDIVNGCRKADIPVFMKSSLADIWGEPLIQEFPEGFMKPESEG